MGSDVGRSVLIVGGVFLLLAVLFPVLAPMLLPSVLFMFVMGCIWYGQEGGPG